MCLSAMDIFFISHRSCAQEESKLPRYITEQEEVSQWPT
jgi:hypothetical protein